MKGDFIRSSAPAGRLPFLQTQTRQSLVRRASKEPTRLAVVHCSRMTRIWTLA
jgi:hypothetical protein